MDQRTIDTYNAMAQAYDDETIDFWERFPISFLDAFAKQSGKDVLNVGSGPGRDGVLLKQRGKSVTCLDASEVMLDRCRSRGLTAVRGDFLALPFLNGSFDAVWAYTSLLHVPKDRIGIALNEIQRVLIDDGIFALGMIEGSWEGYRESSGIAQPRWFSFYGCDELEALLLNHGFIVVSCSDFQPGSKRYLNIIAKKSSA